MSDEMTCCLCSTGTLGGQCPTCGRRFCSMHWPRHMEAVHYEHGTALATERTAREAAEKRAADLERERDEARLSLDFWHSVVRTFWRFAGVEDAPEGQPWKVNETNARLNSLRSRLAGCEAALRDLCACRCEPAYTERGLHAPECHADEYDPDDLGGVLAAHDAEVRAAAIMEAQQAAFRMTCVRCEGPVAEEIAALAGAKEVK